MILAGTGHRPPTLGLDYSGKSETILKQFCSAILRKIIIEEDLTRCVSGGATGWDLALAYSSVDLGVAVTLALPFQGFGSNWPMAAQKAFWSLMEKCTVVYVDEQPYDGAWQYLKRDRYLVDNSDKVLALFNGDRKTGTGATVAYAEKQGKPVLNIWDDWLLYNRS